MSGPDATPAPVRPGTGWTRQVAALGLTFLVVVLPALSGARRLADAPVRDSERSYVRRALADTAGAGPSTLWWRLWLRAEDRAAGLEGAPLTDGDLGRAVVRARLGNLVLLAVVSALLFVAVVLVRGKVAAAGACLALALLPPVAVEGHFVRPELVALAFHMLALVVLLGLPPQLRLRGSPVATLGLGVVTALLVALAVAAAPFLGGTLLWLPGGSLLGAVVPLLIRSGRPLARGRFAAPPVGFGFSRRLLPWLLPAALSLPAAFWTLSTAGAAARGLRAAPSAVAAVPEGWFGFVATLGLAGFGGALLTIRVLHDTLRERRTTRAVVCAAFVLPLAIRGVRAEPGLDALPAAAAVAVVAGLGIAALLWVLVPSGVRNRT